MLEILEYIIVGILSGLFGGFATAAIFALFSNKKTLLTGPLSSGKTTFLRYISEDQIPEGPSGAPKSYKVKNAIFNEVTDFSGAEAWLKAKFDEYIREHDYILFFFDISEYLKDASYRADVNARIDMINRNMKSSQVVLLVGTHVDCVSGNYISDVERFFAGKSYQHLLDRVVYINTQKKECIKTILDKLK